MRSAMKLAFSLCLVIPSPLLVGAEGPPDGFTALFNGKDLTGWKGLVGDPPSRAKMSASDLSKAQESADQKMREHWAAEDGVLVFDGKGDSICTTKDYGDFEMLVDWKILKDGDSGIYLRGSPQVQIWDRIEGSGGLYNNEKNPKNPTVRTDKPVGEWNTFHIKMVGERVTVHLNGTLVVDNVVMENYWDRSQPIYATGQIELQNHGNKLYFRSIYVRELPRAADAPAARASAKAGVLKKGARVAITGDSITEQKLYCRFMEDYLLACLPELDLRVIQLGWSGERAPGFAGRMANDLLPWKPDVVTTCYGMNDGSYRKYEKPIGDAYEQAMKDIVHRLKESGATVVTGSPGAVDTYSFKNPNVSPKDYNENLAHLRDIAKDIAAAEGMPFANVHDAMVKAMEKAKPALGESYDVCGADGFHPRPNGHIVMAYAFLKGMGLDGDLGSITIDMKGPASATGGHTVVSSSAGKAEIESRRYPFCFYGDEKSAEATRSIVPFVPFNDDLNRLTLTAKNVVTPRAKVTWGTASKSFSKEQLEKGINLAAEFLDNPFSDAFRKVDEQVSKKQGFETPMIKDVITRFGVAKSLLGEDAVAEAALETVRQRLVAKDDALHATVRAAIVPVRHTIGVESE
jgi:lysophospholipase L1-like esterase